MIVYNQDKTEILENYDLSIGYLKNDTIHHPAVEKVEEKFHYEPVKTFYNEDGSVRGHETRMIVDVEGVEAKDAYDETIIVYVPYTDEQLQKMEIENQISELKTNLANTDYQAIKYAEGEISAEDYAETKERRKEWRAEINALEEKFKINSENA